VTNASPSKKSKSVKGKVKRKKANISVARQTSLKVLKQVFSGQSLSAVQSQTIDKLEDSRDRGLSNEIVNGVLRWRWRLEFIVSILLAKPLKQKDIDVQLILLMALYELTECRTPDYAIINDAVDLVRKSGKKWAASLVNAVLRRFTREKEELLASINSDQANYSHPDWILDKIKKDWPDDWQGILQ
jgi:16S rRNA (cytosine967-C5)-methyltransferase